MVKLLMGLKGSGKTKKLVDMVCEAIDSDKGDVVVIEKERKLTYDIPYKARLVDAGAYGIDNYELLKGMLCGMHAGNYDITNIFVDNFFKLVGDKSSDALVVFVKWLESNYSVIYIIYLYIYHWIKKLTSDFAISFSWFFPHINTKNVSLF